LTKTSSCENSATFSDLAMYAVSLETVVTHLHHCITQLSYKQVKPATEAAAGLQL
jgi:hypothetical protein